MKVKKFKIIIASSEKSAIDGLFERFKAAWRQAEKGELPNSEHDLILTLPNLSWLSKIFSPKRIRLIQTIREKNPESVYQSVYQLAKFLGRTPSNVQRDVNELADFGIIELKRTRKKGKKRETLQPTYNWDGFDIAV
jgi:predicted transcriptional regulator